MSTRTASALATFLRERDVRPDLPSPLALYRDRWFRVRLGAHQLPVLPTRCLRRGLLVHDLNHLVSGCGTHWAGEIELVGWELASGGCGPSLVWWFDRVVLGLPLGLLTAPRHLLAGLRRGWGRRNLHRAGSVPIQRLLLMDAVALSRRLEPR